MKRCLVAAGVAAGLLSVGPPAAANPAVVVDCPTNLICHGRAVVVQCAPDRGHGIDADCRADVKMHNFTYYLGFREHVLELQDSNYGNPAPGSDLFGRDLKIEARVGPSGVSFRIDTDDKSREPCPRCDDDS